MSNNPTPNPNVNNAPTSALMNFDVLKEIEALLNGITDAQLARYEKKLDPPKENEKALGVIHSKDLRRLWCVTARVRGFAAETIAKISNASTDEEEQALTLESHHLATLAELARVLFWSQCHTDIGSYGENFGIRSGWMAVSWEEEQGPRSFIAKLLGGQ